MGWDLEHKLSQEEILTFLNENSKSGFDQNLSSKLFQVLGLDESQKITVEDFITSYIQFEDDLEQNNLNIFQEEAHKYKDEKLNEEGFCENAK